MNADIARFAARGFVALTLALTACSFDTTHGAIDDGNEALAQGDFAAAQIAYKNAAAELPETPPLNYDQGLAAVAMNEHAGAQSLLLRALDTSDPTLRAKVYAALGANAALDALVAEKTPQAAEPPPAPDGDGANPPPPAGPPQDALAHWTAAVDFLSRALALEPGNVDTRTNLEVALLRVDPPCAARDDKFEENDVAGTAKPIDFSAKPDAAKNGAPPPPDSKPPDQSGPRDVLEWRQQLYACPDDDDWYALELAPGDRLALELTVPEGAGQLTMSLLAPGATTALGTGKTLALTIGPGQGGRYLVHIANIDFDEVSYGLLAKVRPPCEKTEDRFEDNDDRAAAKNVTPGPVPDLKSCPADDDWYAIDLAEGESLFLYVEPAQKPDDEGSSTPKPTTPPDPTAPAAPPPLEVELSAADGTSLGQGAPAGQSRISTLLTPGAGRYFFRVRGTPPAANAPPNDPTSPTPPEPFEGRYSLQVQIVPPCPEGDDRSEDNDMAEDAADFMAAVQAVQAPPPDPNNPDPASAPAPPGPQQSGPPVLLARICPGDTDWWSFSDDGQQATLVSATFEHAKGDLGIVLFDEKGQERIAESNTSTAAQNAEVVAFPLAKPATPDPKNPTPPDPAAPPAAPKKYVLKVSGAAPDVQNFYLLRLDRPQPQSDSDDQKKDDENKDEKDDQKKDDKKQDQDKKQDPPKKDEPDKPFEDALDKLDRNPENLEAKESGKKSPLANHPAAKDW